VVPIPKGKLRVINIDPHNQREKGLIPVPTPQWETMWVHPNIVESQQWTTVKSWKSKGKARVSFDNAVSISIRETEEDVASLTSSGDKESTFVADTGALPISKTWFDRQYLK